MSELVDVWGTDAHCPEDGCHFTFAYANVLSPDEAMALATVITVTHYENAHPERPVGLIFNTIESAGFPRFAPEPSLN